MLGRVQLSLDFPEIQIFLVVNSMFRNEGREKTHSKGLFLTLRLKLQIWNSQWLSQMYTIHTLYLVFLIHSFLYSKSYNPYLYKLSLNASVSHMKKKNLTFLHLQINLAVLDIFFFFFLGINKSFWCSLRITLVLIIGFLRYKLILKPKTFTL